MPRLVNATSRPVFVLVGGERFELPRVPRPMTINEATTSETEVFTVATSDGEGTVSLRVEGDVVPTGAICLPERADGVTYLVPADILHRFPDRDDFVTSGSSTVSLADGKVEATLASVVRSTLPAPVGIPVLAASELLGSSNDD